MCVGSENKDDGNSEGVYSLVGQTSFRPKELRFHQINLTIEQFIAIEPGDVLGLYAPEYNPLPWTSVPCADARQRPLISPQSATSGRSLVVGRRLSFVTAPAPTNGRLPVSSCRQYSFSALLGLCSINIIINIDININIMAARQLAGRRPLYFTADVSILLLFFAV